MKPLTNFLAGAMVCISTLNTYAQNSLPYSNQFNNYDDLDGWSKFYEGDTCDYHSTHGWIINMWGFPTSIPYCLYHGTEPPIVDHGFIRDWIVSPNFNLESGGKAKLSFCIHRASGVSLPDDYAGVYLVITADDTISSAVELINLTGYISSSLTFDEVEIEIPPTEGNNTHIAFVYQSQEPDFSVSIDDLYIEANPSGISDHNALHSSVSLYPNPARNTLRISIHDASVNFDKAIIMDIHGRQLLEQPFKDIIDVSTLDSGIYFLKLKGKVGIVTLKFVVE